MVCLGNICRSPLAEGIMKEKMKRLVLPCFIDSAGTGGWHAGKLPDQWSIDVAGKHGINLSSQRARQIQMEDLDTFDLIFTMDQSVHKDVLSIAENKDQEEKIYLFLDYAGSSNAPIVPDPYWGQTKEFEATYRLIDQACDQIIARLKKEFL